MNSETIYQALFALTASLAWSPDGALAFSSRRVKTFDDLPAQPALCQAETDETMTQVTSLQAVTTLGASWLIYHQAGKDDDAVPAQTTNAILTAVRGLFVDPTEPDEAQTLGGGFRALDSVAGGLQGRAQEAMDLRLVIDDEDTGRGCGG